MGSNDWLLLLKSTENLPCAMCNQNCYFIHYRSDKRGQGVPPINVCVKCYSQGILPENYTTNDFRKVEIMNGSANWTDQETLLLLEVNKKKIRWSRSWSFMIIMITNNIFLSVDDFSKKKYWFIYDLLIIN
jgi:hypothetical protein